MMEKSLCTPRTFLRTAALKPKPFEASSLNVFLLHKNYQYFFQFFFIKIKYVVFFLIFLFFKITENFMVLYPDT